MLRTMSWYRGIAALAVATAAVVCVDSSAFADPIGDQFYFQSDNLPGTGVAEVTFDGVPELIPGTIVGQGVIANESLTPHPGGIALRTDF